MKKAMTFILVLIFMLSFAGCNQNTVGAAEADAVPNKWGIILETENITPGGLTLVCHQSGGDDVFDLMTGSYYGLQKLENAEWVDVAYIPQEYDVAWTSEAWIIQKGGVTRWDINWTWLYGELPAGEYRLVKPISNFRGPGDYDTEAVYAGFSLDK